MDPSIKKKPEKPRMVKICETGSFICYDSQAFAISGKACRAYQEWQRTRAALNKHEGK